MEWLTTKQAAEFLGVTDSRIRQLILEGKLTAQKFGHLNMVNKSDIKNFDLGKVGRPKKEKLK